MTRERTRILLCTPEITEFPEDMGDLANLAGVKAGGLGDITAALLGALYHHPDLEPHVAIPYYRNQIEGTAVWQERKHTQAAFTRQLSARGVHLIKHSSFDNPQVYGKSDGHSPVERAIAFQHGIANLVNSDERFEIVHGNDWMTGLVPAIAKQYGRMSVFTFHNIFTESATLEVLDKLGIHFTDGSRKLLWHHRFPESSESGNSDYASNPVDFLASGILAADAVNTVSAPFLDELVRDVHPQFARSNAVRAIRQKHAQGRMYSILNAPADEVGPEFLDGITNYNSDDSDYPNLLEIRTANKNNFREYVGLHKDESPLFMWPHRFSEQKGLSLFMEAIPHLIDSGYQIAAVADGDKGIEALMRKEAELFPGRFAYHSFNDELNWRGKASADAIIMPSQYEPCGLPQLEAPRFGTLVVARLTGGLRETVQELDYDKDTGNGFVFEGYTARDLIAACDRAAEFVRMPDAIKERTIRRVMYESVHTHSIDETAGKYIAIYEKLLEKK